MIRANRINSEPTTSKANKTKFFSKAGKIRLSRIWEDQHLNDEMIISSWIPGGLSESVVKENVADYLQHFLQARYLRFGSSNIRESNYSQQRSNGYSQSHESGKDKSLGVTHEEYNNTKSLNKRIHRRGVREYDRLCKSVLDGKLTPTSDFKKILIHPVYSANQLDARIQKFENQFGSNPKATFGRRKGIKNVDIPNGSVSSNSKDGFLPSPTITISTKSISTLETPRPPSESIIVEENENIIKSTHESGFSSSSVFQELSPIPGILEEQKFSDSKVMVGPGGPHSSSLSNQNVTEMNSPEQDKLRTRNCSSASSVYITSEPELNNKTTPWVSPFVDIVLTEENTSDMYKLAEEVLWLFRRKLRVSKRFLEHVMNHMTEYYGEHW